MQIYHGNGVGSGIAIGNIKIYKKQDLQVECNQITDVEQEVERFRQAKEEALKQLEQLYEKTCVEVDKESAAIFQAHQILLKDDQYLEVVEVIIRGQKMNAEYAVKTAGKAFSKMFAVMDDDYMKARVADVKDISERLLEVLKSCERADLQIVEPVIILAEDLTPSETVQLDKTKVLAFVMSKGSINSHTAILARTMGIPALVGTDMIMHASLEGKLGVVDGAKGIIYIEPDAETLETMRNRLREEQEKNLLFQELKGKENVTFDGQKIKLRANIGNIKDLASVLQNDADGIGLFRSEFIYLERDTFPTEEEQFQLYRTVLETMAGKQVVIRTMDIGADKQCDYLKTGKEENPALGYRAIRICLSQPEIFKTQLRALLRAGVYGELAIMYPMIISVEEVKRIKTIIAEVKEELAQQHIPYGNPRQGIMIETPAAVMISDMLAKEVDFFSIGTNDLTQYTLAIDRQNAKMNAFYDAKHPAVLRMIEMVVRNAHEAGIEVGICGELGADISLTKDFLAMGVDELSVSPECVLPIRKIVLETDVEEYKKHTSIMW